MAWIIYILLFILLTIITQTGGIILIVAVLLGKIIRKHRKTSKFTTAYLFIFLYLLSMFTVVPYLAKKFGRVPLPIYHNSYLSPASFTSYIFNRHYVKKELKDELQHISEKFQAQFPNSKVLYLDTNFPFINRFPLLPHLSHNDGKKVDLALCFLKNGNPYLNKTPTLTGYGYFIDPIEGGFDQNEYCKSKGKWQYDFPGKLVFGNKEKYQLDETKTACLMQLIVSSNKIKKIFLEPHLKNRLGFVTSQKVRFQGCHSVRHDDHIHIQL